ncbi:MAG TPA: FAD-linked oxidase C-terminal domain-containing protein [Candidatus Kapabacteria bacterium]|nr:FAD-linked oxidase C-terminal domain-containing protein [Candidatus Kapabacteria bacterium]
MTDTTLFQGILPPECVLTDATDRLTYDADAVTLERITPQAVLLVNSTKEIQNIVRYCNERNISYLTRGAGTGLSGGAIACGESVMIVTSGMNRILEINPEEQWALVESGVVNGTLSKEVKKFNLHFAPDPSSGAASTIGGNIAENAGGPHCLKYGATAEHILGLEVVLPDGELVWLDNKGDSAPLLSLMIGSEGTLGIVTKAKVKLTPLPEAVETLLVDFPTPRDASETVSAIIASGIIPAALEMIDSEVLDALEEAFHLGFPRDAGALLLIELDGRRRSLARLVKQVELICKDHHSRTIRIAANEIERNALWQARKKAFGALGRVSPSYYTQDGVIPRYALPDVLEEIYRIGKSHHLRIANIFHAGDGNLHPAILYDERDPESIRRCLAASADILKLCIAKGGSITGEHGVGIEKREALGWMFGEMDITIMARLRTAFNLSGLLNPAKFLPTDHPCVEVGTRHRKVPV